MWDLRSSNSHFFGYFYTFCPLLNVYRWWSWWWWVRAFFLLCESSCAQHVIHLIDHCVQVECVFVPNCRTIHIEFGQRGNAVYGPFEMEELEWAQSVHVTFRFVARAALCDCVLSEF